MTILILHGIQSSAGKHWMQWLHDELEKVGHTVLMPSLPSADHPDRGEWLGEIRNLLDTIDPEEDVCIVGHSLGVTSALDYCETTHREIKALVSVSGFAKAFGAELNEYFLMEKTIDMNKVKEHCENFFVMFGDDDPYVPQEVLQQLAQDLNVTPIVVPHGGHLNTATGFLTLPEVLEYLTSLPLDSQ